MEGIVAAAGTGRVVATVETAEAATADRCWIVERIS